MTCLYATYHQEQNEYTQEDHNYGYFANGGSCYIKEAEQWQFVLRYNNSTLKDVAKDFAAFNAIYAEALGDSKPARSCVGVAELPKGVLVEVEAIAICK